jgi:hypothetical protein
MNTLFDFISHVNGMTYLLALGSIAGFAVYLELFKARPFAEILESARDDYRFVRELGIAGNKRVVKNVVKGVFMAASYLVALPFLFMRGLLQAAGELASAVAQPGWSPVRAYFTGRRKGKKAQPKDDNNDEPESTE